MRYIMDSSNHDGDAIWRDTAAEDCKTFIGFQCNK
jgi:hypothetical protein